MAVFCSFRSFFRRCGEPLVAHGGLSPTEEINYIQEKNMLNWALTFLVVAVIAAIFGFGGIAAASAEIAKILFVVFLVLFVVAAAIGALRGRTPPV